MLLPFIVNIFVKRYKNTS